MLDYIVWTYNISFHSLIMEEKKYSFFRWMAAAF